MRVLIAEDEPRIAGAVARGLRREGMAVDIAADGAAALYKARVVPYDVVVLDRDLPAVHGDDVCRTLAVEQPATKVLMLTAARSTDDLVAGLSLGADDYLPKPFDLDELVARLQALARRHAGARPEPGGAMLKLGGLLMEKDSGAVYFRDQVMELTPRETALLQALMGRPGHAVSKEKLFELVFPGEADVHYEAIEVVVYRLRKKLAHTGTTLMTLRGLGYLLKDA
jgi:two-component system, OmpR family, response regulator TctD